MIVFNNYFKVLKKHLGLIIMFVGITVGISIANTSSNNTAEAYIAENPEIAIINRDSSELTNDFIEYMNKNTKLKEVEDNKKAIQDALYYTKVSAIIIIPKNYTQEFLEGKEPQIGIKKSSQNYSTYIELLTNRYFKIANIYNTAGISEEEMMSKIKNDLEKQITIELEQKENISNMSKVAIFYVFENYALLSIIILAIGTIMCIFNNKDIKKRNLISKLNYKKINNQLFLGHVCLTMGIWALFVIVSIIIYKEAMFTVNGLLMIINSLFFAITTASMAYLISTFVKNQNVLSGIQNVFGLGLSFISGCFVPKEFMNPTVINISKIFPSYWYIQTNYKIAEMSSYDMEILKPIFINYAIILGYGILYFTIRKLIYQKKIKSN